MNNFAKRAYTSDVCNCICCYNDCLQRQLEKNRWYFWTIFFPLSYVNDANGMTKRREIEREKNRVPSAKLSFRWKLWNLSHSSYVHACTHGYQKGIIHCLRHRTHFPYRCFTRCLWINQKNVKQWNGKNELDYTLFTFFLSSSLSVPEIEFPRNSIVEYVLTVFLWMNIH